MNYEKELNEKLSAVIANNNRGQLMSDYFALRTLRDKVWDKLYHSDRFAKQQPDQYRALMTTREEALAVAMEQIDKVFANAKVKSPLRQHVATFRTGKPFARDTVQATMYFGYGKFDEWCIYIHGNSGCPKVPTDLWALEILLQWSNKRPAGAIYNDFCRIYELVTDKSTYEFTKPVIAMIEAIAFNYPDYIQACVLWTYFYMGMIAEENKKGPGGEKLPLRRRIKRLGVYMVLMEDKTPEFAANYSRGLGADYLDKVCYYRGF